MCILSIVALRISMLAVELFSAKLSSPWWIAFMILPSTFSLGLVLGLVSSFAGKLYPNACVTLSHPLDGLSVCHSRKEFISIFLSLFGHSFSERKWLNCLSKG